MLKISTTTFWYAIFTIEVRLVNFLWWLGKMVLEGDYYTLIDFIIVEIMKNLIGVIIYCIKNIQCPEERKMQLNSRQSSPKISPPRTPSSRLSTSPISMLSSHSMLTQEWEELIAEISSRLLRLLDLTRSTRSSSSWSLTSMTQLEELPSTLRSLSRNSPTDS